MQPQDNTTNNTNDDQYRYVDLETLRSIGVALEGEELNALLEHINEKIETAIGEEVIEELDDEQLKEMAQLEETSTDEELAVWIAQHVPVYKEIVEDNIAIVLGDLAESSDQIG